MTQVQGIDTGALIHGEGESWRKFRLEQLISVAGPLIGGVPVLLVPFGHMYLGTATEGAIKGMRTGLVDENWAKEHHDLWYEEMKGGAGAVASQPAPQPEIVPGLEGGEPAKGAQHTPSAG